MLIGVIVIAAIIAGLLIVVCDAIHFLSSCSEEGGMPATPYIGGWCHTCGKETDGAYYCSMGCYLAQEDD